MDMSINITYEDEYESTLLPKELEIMLNKMNGHNVNIYLLGLVHKYFCFEEMIWYTEEKNNLEEWLYISSENDEEEFSIMLDEIQNVVINEFLGQILIIYNNQLQIQIWVDDPEELDMSDSDVIEVSEVSLC